MRASEPDESSAATGKAEDDDTELKEYFALLKCVSESDQRILTVKGWGVTLSLAALGFGFQYRSYGMFLVAAASSPAFWTLEGLMKRHQVRHYPRMRQIEVNRYRSAPDQGSHVSAPRIDWSWNQAKKVFHGNLADPFSYSYVWKILTRAADKAGIGHIASHTFRHTFRTWLDSTGTPVGVHQKLMRHADIRTTMNIYGDAMTEDMREAQQKVARMAIAGA